jgi:hypothetical protein
MAYEFLNRLDPLVLVTEGVVRSVPLFFADLDLQPWTLGEDFGLWTPDFG